MSGNLITVMPPTLYDFGALGTNDFMFFVLGSRIDATGAQSGVVQVRLHTVNIANAADFIQIEVVPDGYTPDDPGQFQLTGNPVALVTFNGPLTAGPLFETMPLDLNFGSLLRVDIVATRDANPGALQAKLSVELLLETEGTARAPMARMPGTYLGYR